MIQQVNLYRPLPQHILSVGRFNGIANLIDAQTLGGFSGVAWLGNNVAVYVPLTIPQRFTVARFMISNADADGNIDIGLYNAAGTRLISTGTQTRTGSSVVQYYGVTDQSFPPGNYYIALVVSTTGGQVFGVNLNDQYLVRSCGVLQETLGSTVLPASMTPVSYTLLTNYWFGFTQSDTL